MDQALEDYSLEKLERVQVFDIKALAESTRKIHVLKDPDLGEIRYGLLSQSEFAALHLETISSDKEKTERVVYAMLQKADPSLAWEDYAALPFDLREALTLVMSESFRLFLRVQQRIGLQFAPKPKT